MSDRLGDIETFVLIAEHGSLSEAARVSGLSLAVVSRRLQRLEARLGVQLVLRSTRHLALTDDGKGYALSCQRILADWRDVDQRLQEDHQSASGLLRITSTFAFARRELAPLVAEFSQVHPKLRIHLDASDRVVDLLNEDIDMAVRFGSLVDSSLHTTSLTPNAYVFCAAPDYLNRHGRPQTLEDLQAHIGVLFGAHSPDRWRLSGQRAIFPKRKLTTNDGELAHSWMLDGAGIGLKSIWDVYRDLRKGHLELVLPDYALGQRQLLHLVYPDGPLKNVKIRLFTEFLRPKLRQIWDADIRGIIPKLTGA